MEKENIGLDKNIFCVDQKSDLSQGKCIMYDMNRIMADSCIC